MTPPQAMTELAVLIGRARGAALLSDEDTRYAAGCLAVLAEAAHVSTPEIREAIAPVDLDAAKACLH